MKSLIAHVAVYTAVLGGAIAVASSTGLINMDRPAGQNGPSVTERPTNRINVHGHIRKLYPGVASQMTVRVQNRYPHRVRLVSLRVRDADASAICTKRYLQVANYRGRKLIRARHTGKIRMSVRMRATAPDECQNARWPLTYHAKVKKAGRVR